MSPASPPPANEVSLTLPASDRPVKQTRNWFVGLISVRVYTIVRASEGTVETLLLHVPKLEDYYPPFGRYMNVNYMPMGMLALSAHLARSGHPTEVVHAGIEKILDPGWRVADLVSSRGFRAVGLSLHWHYQAYDVARAVERIRSVRPDLFLFAGGITASYFGREMLETIPGLDAVVIGESFEPVRRMLDALERGGTPAGVPNLAWRESGEGREGSIVVNPETLLHPPEFFENLPFADFSAFPRAGRYVAQFGFPRAYSWELTPEENRAMMTMGRTFFPLFTGSGCARSCTYCGGNARTQRRAFHHHRILWRSHRAVLDDIRRALDAGYRTMALCFDPMPESTAWYVELFSRMRRETPEADLYFECWSLPDPEFVRAFADTFSPPHSYLALSPDSGSEQVRRANKGYFYTNDQLFRTADLLKKHGVQMDVFFSIGFPGETVPLALET
ncbi:MAG: radical SAM protein, partial [Deltaproteobacteria bacterium]|nr:radical SAM protein [Deltaproteobacteria bacterium]